MREETFRLSQKELQRVAVISSCVKGDLERARVAELLDLTPRHVQRLTSRYRLGGEATLAHPRRGPQLTLLGFLDDATCRVPVAEFFPTEDARGYF
jgi:hypothetical protein